MSTSSPESEEESAYGRHRGYSSGSASSTEEDSNNYGTTRSLVAKRRPIHHDRKRNNNSSSNKSSTAVNPTLTTIPPPVAATNFSFPTFGSGGVTAPSQSVFVFGNSTPQTDEKSGLATPFLSSLRQFNNARSTRRAVVDQKSADKGEFEINSIFSTALPTPIFGLSSKDVIEQRKTNVELYQKNDESLFSILKLSSSKGMSAKIHEMILRNDKKIKIKPYDRDLVLENGDLKVHAFKPLLNCAAPNFCKNVICNEELLKSLEETEVETLNEFISCIYLRETLSNFKLFPNLVFLLFLVDASQDDFINNKKNILYYLTYIYLSSANAVDSLVSIDKYISMRKSLFSDDAGALLEIFRINCLEFIGTHSSCKEFDFTVDPRVKDYVLEFYRYKQITHDRSNNPPYPFVNIGINTLYNNKETSDVVVTIPNSDGGETKTIYCHKTILSSISEIIETSFSPNWSNEQDEDGRTIFTIDHLKEIADPVVMSYIIDYAYGSFSADKVLPKHVIPLIKASHFYRILGLLDECLYICLKNDRVTYFEVAESLEDHFDDETMQAFEDIMVEIGCANYSLILHARDEDLMRLPKRLLIKIFRKVTTTTNYKKI